MEKEATTPRPEGVCEKLFNVFNPASRSHRRLTLHQKPEATTNPSPTQPNHSLDYGLKEPSPQKPLSTPPPPDQIKKPPEAIAPKAEPKPTNPPPPPPIPTSVPVQKVPDKMVLTSAPPKAAATPQPVPQPAPPRGTAAPERPKKNINEKVEEYIKRARDRMRSVSGVGRTPTS